MNGLRPATRSATISPVGAAAVRPTWPWPNAKNAFGARCERPITGIESGSDGRCPIQRRTLAARRPGSSRLRLFEQRIRAAIVRRRVEARELDGARDAQALFHRRDEVLALAGRDRNARRHVRRLDHHVIAALGFERYVVAELRRPAPFECAPAAMTTASAAIGLASVSTRATRPSTTSNPVAGAVTKLRAAGAQAAGERARKPQRVRDSDPAPAARRDA